MKISHTLIFSFALMVNAADVAADTFEDGMAAYWKGDYETAMQLYRDLAHEGHAKAQTMLPIMYLNGNGAEEEFPEALKWFRAAAELGDPEAEIPLGNMYQYGSSVPKDYVVAYMWYEIAAT